MRAAIYARVSTKARALCSSCGKKIRLVDSRFIPHKTREYQPCAGSDNLVPDEANKGQDTENQLLELREYSQRKNWIVTKEYLDRKTAKNAERDSFRDLFDGAARREFDVVLVWALDRFTREGIYETFDHVRKLSKYGVEFESFTEPQFRTTGDTGELMLSIAAWIAKQERKRISERTKAGVQRAKAQGKHCGRPVHVFRRERARELRRQGKGWRTIAAEVGVPVTTLRRALS